MRYILWQNLAFSFFERLDFLEFAAFLFPGHFQTIFFLQVQPKLSGLPLKNSPSLKAVEEVILRSPRNI